MSVTRLPGGMADLDVELHEYLVVDVIGSIGGPSDKTVIDRKKYLSFRIMDMFNMICLRLGPRLDVFKLVSKYNWTYKTQSVFFGLQFESVLIVLQFNKMSYGD